MRGYVIIIWYANGNIERGKKENKLSNVVHVCMFVHGLWFSNVAEVLWTNAVYKCIKAHSKIWHGDKPCHFFV